MDKTFGLMVKEESWATSLVVPWTEPRRRAGEMYWAVENYVRTGVVDMVTYRQCSMHGEDDQHMHKQLVETMSQWRSLTTVRTAFQ